MTDRVYIPLEELKRLLSYDPTTGVFRWQAVRKGRCWIGSIPGYINENGYRIISLAGRNYGAHRLAWFYVYGTWPPGEIDHINRVPDDNRISNLRIANRSENMANTSHFKNNKSGLKGAYPSDGKWRSSIRKDGKSIHLGRFNTAEDAHRAYCEAARRIHGEFARVR